MKILTLGDSWTYGSDSSDPATMSWPAQMAKKYNVEVVNLAVGGIGNNRAARIGIEELCKDPDYDYVIFPLAPASRTEILKHGKWHRIWPGIPDPYHSPVDRIFTEFWHPWNDVQYTIQLAFYFIHSIKALEIPLYMTGLSLHPSQYKKEIDWILNYKNDCDFESLDMPLKDFDIGIKDLDRKLKGLKAVHQRNLHQQPEYLSDVLDLYLMDQSTQQKYQYTYKKFLKGFEIGQHPDDNGYAALADYFAEKIGLT
jgi:hypothetical protein